MRPVSRPLGPAFLFSYWPDATCSCGRACSWRRALSATTSGVTARLTRPVRCGYDPAFVPSPARPRSVSFRLLGRTRVMARPAATVATSRDDPSGAQRPRVRLPPTPPRVRRTRGLRATPLRTVFFDDPAPGPGKARGMAHCAAGGEQRTVGCRRPRAPLGALPAGLAQHVHFGAVHGPTGPG